MQSCTGLSPSERRRRLEGGWRGGEEEGERDEGEEGEGVEGEGVERGRERGEEEEGRLELML